MIRWLGSRQKLPKKLPSYSAVFYCSLQVRALPGPLRQRQSIDRKLIVLCRFHKICDADIDSAACPPKATQAVEQPIGIARQNEKFLTRLVIEKTGAVEGNRPRIFNLEVVEFPYMVNACSDILQANGTIETTSEFVVIGMAAWWFEVGTQPPYRSI